jgi:hypothetical protein
MSPALSSGQHVVKTLETSYSIAARWHRLAAWKPFARFDNSIHLTFIEIWRHAWFNASGRRIASSLRRMLDI